jgi:hypothetical protein
MMLLLRVLMCCYNGCCAVQGASWKDYLIRQDTFRTFKGDAAFRRRVPEVRHYACSIHCYTTLPVGLYYHL